MSDITYLTKESYDKFMEELHILKTVEREKAAAAIAEAREKGDLSENAEYDAAKNAQGMLELKINTLEKNLAKAKILDKSTLDISSVTILSTVKIKNLKTKKVLAYTLVSEQEADFKQNKISVTSPIGKGLIGSKIGEIAEVISPRGMIKFEILDITM